MTTPNKTNAQLYISSPYRNVARKRKKPINMITTEQMVVDIARKLTKKTDDIDVLPFIQSQEDVIIKKTSLKEQVESEDKTRIHTRQLVLDKNKNKIKNAKRQSIFRTKSRIVDLFKRLGETDEYNSDYGFFYYFRNPNGHVSCETKGLNCVPSEIIKIFEKQNKEKTRKDEEIKRLKEQLNVYKNYKELYYITVNGKGQHIKNEREK